MLTLLVGCNKFHNMPDTWKPSAWILEQVPKDATPAQKQGWLDGCKSGMGNMTNSGYRSFYRFTQDPELRKDPAYYKVWKDTYTFCRHYVYGIVRQSDSRMRLSNNIRSLHERVAAGHNLLEYNLANWWGPPGEGIMFENFGWVGGNPYPGDIGGPGNLLDFSDGMAMNGKRGGEHMNWDFYAGSGKHKSQGFMKGYSE